MKVYRVLCEAALMRCREFQKSSENIFLFLRIARKRSYCRYKNTCDGRTPDSVRGVTMDILKGGECDDEEQF